MLPRVSPAESQKKRQKWGWRLLREARKPVPGVSGPLQADRREPDPLQDSSACPQANFYFCLSLEWPLQPLVLWEAAGKKDRSLLLSGRISVTSTCHKSKVKDESVCEPQWFRLKQESTASFPSFINGLSIKAIFHSSPEWSSWLCYRKRNIF